MGACFRDSAIEITSATQSSRPGLGARHVHRILADVHAQPWNRHIDVAGPFAANLRLFEATGVGTCLVTGTRGTTWPSYSSQTARWWRTGLQRNAWRSASTYSTTKASVRRLRGWPESNTEGSHIARRMQDYLRSWSAICGGPESMSKGDDALSTKRSYWQARTTVERGRKAATRKAASERPTTAGLGREHLNGRRMDTGSSLLQMSPGNWLKPGSHRTLPQSSENW